MQIIPNPDQKKFLKIWKTKPTNSKYSIEERDKPKGIANILNKKIISQMKRKRWITILKTNKEQQITESENELPWHIIIRTLNVQGKKDSKSCKGKDYGTRKGRPITITSNFKTKTLRARRAWLNTLQALNDYIEARS